jgi:hypothetical protein
VLDDLATCDEIECAVVKRQAEFNITLDRQTPCLVHSPLGHIDAYRVPCLTAYNLGAPAIVAPEIEYCFASRQDGYMLVCF